MPVVALLVLTMMLSPAVWATKPQRSTSETGAVPFTLERAKVIVPTSVNGSRKLSLILDTGMGFDGVYLFHKELADTIDTSGAVQVRVPGAGDGEASTALMIESGTLQFGNVVVDSQRVIIAHSPYTQGFPTDGVIGWNLFGHYAVEINYDTELITLHNQADFQPDSGWTAIPVTMKGNLPFFDAVLEAVDGERVPVTLYVDLASGEALEMLTGPDQVYTLPDSLEESYLGTGLSGDIHGQRGRVAGLQLASFPLNDIPTSFASAKIRSKQEGADGILGNDFIRRFNIIFDYTNERLFVKPSKYFEQPFE